MFTLNKMCNPTPTITRVGVLCRDWVDMASVYSFYKIQYLAKTVTKKVK